jgi:hypothetical protein
MAYSFCQGGNESVLTPFVLRIARDLGPFLLMTSEDTLSLVLETLSVVVEVNGGKWLTPELGNSLVIAVLEVWSKNNKGKWYTVLFGIPDTWFLSRSHIFVSPQ